jgi:hypothetical protein
MLDSTLCDKVCQWRTTGQWFSPGTPVSSANKTDSQYNWNIVESGVKHHKPKKKTKTSKKSDAKLCCLFHMQILLCSHMPKMKGKKLCSILSSVSILLKNILVSW